MIKISKEQAENILRVTPHYVAYLEEGNDSILLYIAYDTEKEKIRFMPYVFIKHINDKKILCLERTLKEYKLLN